MARNKRVVILAEETKPYAPIVKAMRDKGIDAQAIPLSDIALIVENGVPGIASERFGSPDGVFLQVPGKLMLFAEPLLSELTERGIYCQIKPTAFTVLANKPFLYATLNERGVRVQKVSLVGDAKSVESAIAGHKYPVLVEAFQGSDKTQRMIIESKLTLTSFLKSLPFRFDVLSIREFLKGDLYESLVVGKDIYSTKAVWKEGELGHAKKRNTATLKDEDKTNILKATRAIGCDIAHVKSIDGFIVSVRPIVNLEEKYNTDTAKAIATFFAEKL